jgi:hypothetical protein
MFNALWAIGVSFGVTRGGTGATLNVTFAGVYFADKLHPTHAGHQRLSTIASAAINSL